MAFSTPPFGIYYTMSLTDVLTQTLTHVLTLSTYLCPETVQSALCTSFPPHSALLPPIIKFYRYTAVEVHHGKTRTHKSFLLGLPFLALP